MKPTDNQTNRTTIIDGLPLKTWWATLLVLPLSVRLIHWLVNKTTISPNTITVIGLSLRLLTAALFAVGTPETLMGGALAYIAAYVCDCSDGAVARITGKTSEFGRYLDHVSDLAGDIIILLALAWSQHCINQPWLWAMVFMHVAECYISYLSGFVLASHNGTLGDVAPLRWFNRYRSWFFRRNLKSFLSFPDYTALVFVICPLLGVAAVGLHWGFYLLLAVCLYTVLSTFASIHSVEKRFP